MQTQALVRIAGVSLLIVAWSQAAGAARSLRRSLTRREPQLRTRREPMV
jgi:hypothetical protein